MLSPAPMERATWMGSCMSAEAHHPMVLTPYHVQPLRPESNGYIHANSSAVVHKVSLGKAMHSSSAFPSLTRTPPSQAASTAAVTSLPSLQLARPATCRFGSCSHFAIFDGSCREHANNKMPAPAAPVSITSTRPRFECSISNVLSALPSAAPALAELAPTMRTLPSLIQHCKDTTAAPAQTAFQSEPRAFQLPVQSPPRSGHRPHIVESHSPANAPRTSIRKSTAAPSSSSSKSTVKCRRDNCNNAARRKGLCMEHGGRHFCKMDGCQKCAHRGGFCISHGGGRRCAVDNCTKSAQSGGICYSHGGGKRCATDGCSHAARSGGYCIKHGKQLQ